MISSVRGTPGSLRLAIPTLTIGIAVLLDMLPLPHAGPTATAPLVTLCGLYFWLIYRPSPFDPALIFVAGTLLDALSHIPLGLTALAFLCARALLLPKDRFLATSPFLVVWCCFMIAAGVALGFRWLIAGLWWERPMPISGAIFEWFLTVLFYPVVGYLLAMAMPLMPKVKHASGK